jgi:hypothetical protein
MDVTFPRTPNYAYILRITLFYEVECEEAPFGSAYCLTQCDILEGHGPEQHRSKNLQTPRRTIFLVFFLFLQNTF